MSSTQETEPAAQHAEVIALVRYHVTPADIAKTTAEYGALSADTPAGYEEVRKAIGYCRTTRVAVEARRKQLKASSLEFGRRVDKAAKDLVALIEPIEASLQAKKDAVDAEKERVKREAAEAERRAAEEKVRLEREAEEARLRAEREVEEARIAEQRAQLEREQAALAEQKRQLDAQRAETERLQRELAEAKTKAEHDEAVRQAKIQAEKETAERLERERIEAEERRVREVERQAELARRLDALKPDVEKVRAFAQTISELSAPAVQSAEAQQAVAVAMAALVDVVNGLQAFADQPPTTTK
jgi:chromosome segregation ATPase